jgi:Flp pilus assembly protein TadD
MLAPVASASFMPRGKTAALHALEIDDTLLEARSALAFVTRHDDWKWKAAERALRRMLNVEPGDAVSHVWYALLLAERGRFSDAVAEARRAQPSTPGNLVS